MTRPANPGPPDHDPGAQSVLIFRQLFDPASSTYTYLLGDRITEADWRLFTTLIRVNWGWHWSQRWTPMCTRTM